MSLTNASNQDGSHKQPGSVHPHTPTHIGYVVAANTNIVLNLVDSTATRWRSDVNGPMMRIATICRPVHRYVKSSLDIGWPIAVAQARITRAVIFWVATAVALAQSQRSSRSSGL